MSQSPVVRACNVVSGAKCRDVMPKSHASDIIAVTKSCRTTKRREQSHGKLLPKELGKLCTSAHDKLHTGPYAYPWCTHAMPPSAAPGLHSGQ